MAERRVTSVLFGDLVAFTTLSESRDAEEVRELLSRYFAECRTIVARYGGTVEKFIGDAVMAVWGVPVAHEDDASRAVLAGLALVDAVAAFGEQVGAQGLSMRVGVVTGEVAVTVGATGEGMVAGDAVNTASRVQSTATPGTVWADDATRALTSASIAYTDEGAHALKGKAEPVPLFSVLAVVGDMTTGGRADGLEARLAGRDRELRTLKELYHATEEAGRPRLVVVDGEAGIGKSRLAWEFEKYVDGLSGTVRWHRGRCLSYGDGVAFWALSEAVRTRLGLVEGDTGSVVTDRLAAGLAPIVPDEKERDWLGPRLGVLIGATGETPYAREELFAAWTTFFERVGAEDPVVILIDDAEHADDALLDFLDHLLATARGAIFVLALARPELLDRRASLGGRRTSVVRLDTLDDAAMARLVDDLVAGLPATVRDDLVRHADGVPLFAVETVRALIDKDMVVPRDGRYVPAEGARVDLEAIGAPVSLHALVASRLDALTADERRVVRDASVLGESFTRGGLAALMASTAGADSASPDADDSLDPALASLCQKEILTIQRDPFSAAVGQYRFVQAIVRQVAYSMQSKRDRKMRHLAAAEFLSAQPDVGDELSVVVAQHLLDAVDASASTDLDVQDLTERARALLEAAAQRALAMGATAEALRLFTRALAYADDPASLARLHEGAASAAHAVGDYQGAIRHAMESTGGYDRLGDAAGAGRAVALHSNAVVFHGDNRGALEVAGPRRVAMEREPRSPEIDTALSELYFVLVGAYTGLGDVEEGTELALRSVELAEARGDLASTAHAMVQLSNQFFARGANQTALTILEGAVNLARRAGVTLELARALNNLQANSIPADLGKSALLADDAVEAARHAGDRYLLFLTLFNQTVALWTAGRLIEMVGPLAEMAEIENELDPGRRLLEWWLAEALGKAAAPPTDGAEGPDEDGSTASDTAATQAWAGALDVARARSAGEIGEAMELAEAVLASILLANGLLDDFMHLWPPLVLTAIEGKDVELAERLLAPVTSAAPGQVSPGVAAYLPRFRGLVGALRGDAREQVEADLREGVHRLTDFGAVGFAAQAQVELADWLAGQGRSEEADGFYASARETFERIAALGWLAQVDNRIARAGSERGALRV